MIGYVEHIQFPRKYVAFDNLNFKLAVIQVLMYDLEVLKPRFDIYDFAEQSSGEEIDTESETIIKPALDYFADLPIPADLADKVKQFPNLKKATIVSGNYEKVKAVLEAAGVEVEPL
ncbi:MAG: hypothetical protein ACFWT7_01015 [Succiniclasticum sp.]|jgi:hypothetical protein